MNTEEAMSKIEEINSIIQSSNKALFSGRHMMLYGVIVLLIPIIGISTQWFTFGHDFGNQTTMVATILSTAIFWGISVLASRFVPRSVAIREAKESQHPLIQKAFSISRPIMFAIAGVVAVFSLMGQGQLIYPIVLILLGIQFSVFGKFTIPLVSHFAWTYIAAGLLLVYLHQYEIPHLTLFFLLYNGITYILMGLALNQAELVHAK